MLAYKAQFNYARNYGPKLFKNYIEISYEDLVKNPMTQLKKITDFLGINFEKEMLEYYKNSSEVVMGEEISWKEDVFNPILIRNIDKWKDNLSNNDVKLIEFTLSDEMNHLGYKKYFDQNSLSFKISKSAYNLI